ELAQPAAEQVLVGALPASPILRRRSRARECACGGYTDREAATASRARFRSPPLRTVAAILSARDDLGADEAGCFLAHHPLPAHAGVHAVFVEPGRPAVGVTRLREHPLEVDHAGNLG